jgi:hypothetical protein
MLVLRLGRKIAVDHLTFAPDGRSLAAVGGSVIHLWREIADGSVAAPLTGPGATYVRFTADGRWLFTGGRELSRVDPATGADAILWLWGGYPTSFDTSPAAPHVLVAQGRYADGEHRTRMALWRADDLSAAGQLWEREMTGFTHLPVRFFGPDQFARVEYLFRSDEKSAYRAAVHDADTGELLEAVRFAFPFPYEWLAPPDGSRLAVRGTYQIDVFRLNEPGAAPLRLSNDSRRHFTGLAFHPSGRYLAAASNDETVKLYDTTTGEVRAFTWKLGRLRSIAFSADGTLAAAGTDKGQVVVWDVDL